MAKTNKSTLGNYDSARAFLDTLSTSVDIPAEIKVIDTNNGIINDSQENQRPWASLTCVEERNWKEVEQ